MNLQKEGKWIAVLCIVFSFLASVAAVESGQFRLLSATISCKMILISQIPNKTKYILDASTAKITIDEKPAEFQNIQAYTIVNVKFDLKKSSKDGIEIDGIASEIKISTPENKK
jgi:hypothetical protein